MSESELLLLRSRVKDAANALRNRIAAILGLGQEADRATLPPVARESLDKILVETRSTIGLIDELLAAAGEEPVPLPHVSPQAPSVGGAHVLVVEDDDANRGILTRVLHRMGHHVTPACDGIEAFDALAMGGIDCVVSDFQMPHLGGQSLFQQVENRLPHYAGRFIFVTGDYTRAETREFLEKTGQPVLGKPYELDELAAAVARVVARIDPKSTHIEQ